MENTIKLEEVARITALVTNDLTEYVKAGGSGMSTKEKFLKYLEDEDYRSTFENIKVTNSVKNMLNSVVDVYSYPRSDFEFTVHDALFFTNGNLKNYINTKVLGIVIYAFVGAHRYLVQKEEERKIAENSKSEFFGNVGDKIDLELIYDKTFCFEDGGAIHFFHDSNENVFKWSTEKSIDCEVGDKVNISGRIKAHQEYKGIKQTSITRCKIA